MFWIFLVLLAVIGGATAVRAAGNARRRALGPGTSTARALPAGGDPGVERTARDPRVNDVLTIDGKDFIVEGMINYDEDGHRWTGARVVDGDAVKWLVVGLERTGTSAMRLLIQDEATQIAGYPPEILVIGDIRYALDKRGAATCSLFGDVGPLGALKKDRPEGHVERARWWLYAAPGDDTLLLEQWGADYRLLRGKKISEGTIDLIPGS
ncbi:MAG TPA: DUF4178 domain-containing protein [Kofleriaceae bacterium]|nr:DUF4178 domain-containing protein [Kofleriaceae bacterium]